ncbi:hypothetical protein [Chryseobacterium koreense]|uniref:Cytochrome c domain-containing protein n=1 Tax=Chryseobacterium koreense CCUG 49689 TaxID=1304281 RepID=A0A0J7IWM6_9FLAO|nr:hypothetical protein [Chryseobacterium koreense]KMQ70199.1 hypothetical protein ACM44_13595 [Chryseobacterium koreense CCUG 49689]MBB5334814.1 putative membrane protein [Chryseobacterium koreense]
MENAVKIIFVIILFSVTSCDTRTFDEISPKVVIPAEVTYNQNVKPLIDNNCVTCHSAVGAANFYPLTDYSLVKNAIDHILDRVQRPAGDPGKMPQGGSLSTTNIDILKKWKADGLHEQ